MMRVRADMPTTYKTYYCFLSLIAILMIPITIGVLGHYYKKSLHEALPMSGVCKDVSMKSYVGDGDKDGKYCTWLNNTYFCAFDPNKDLWSCQVTQ